MLSLVKIFFMPKPLSLRAALKAQDSAILKSNLNCPLHNVTECYKGWQLTFLTSPGDIELNFNVIVNLVPVKSFARSGWFIRQWLANFTHSRRMGTWISLNLFRNKTMCYNKKKYHSPEQLDHFYTVSNTL